MRRPDQSAGGGPAPRRRVTPRQPAGRFGRSNRRTRLPAAAPTGRQSPAGRQFISKTPAGCQRSNRRCHFQTEVATCLKLPRDGLCRRVCRRQASECDTRVAVHSVHDGTTSGHAGELRSPCPTWGRKRSALCCESKTSKHVLQRWDSLSRNGIRCRELYNCSGSGQNCLLDYGCPASGRLPSGHRIHLVLQHVIWILHVGQHV